MGKLFVIMGKRNRHVYDETDPERGDLWKRIFFRLKRRDV